MGTIGHLKGDRRLLESSPYHPNVAAFFVIFLRLLASGRADFLDQLGLAGLDL